MTWIVIIVNRGTTSFSSLPPRFPHLAAPAFLFSCLQFRGADNRKSLSRICGWGNYLLLFTFCCSPFRPEKGPQRDSLRAWQKNRPDVTVDQDDLRPANWLLRGGVFFFWLVVFWGGRPAACARPLLLPLFVKYYTYVVVSMALLVSGTSRELLQ